MRSRVGFRHLAMLFCLIAVLSVPLFGQSARGTITGTVVDNSGGVVPGVEITATNVDNGTVTRTVTTDVGLYRIPYVVPGKYRVSATLTGFKTTVRENVDVLPTQTVTVNLKLEVGELSQQVTVVEAAPMLEASTSEIGTAATELEVHTWPIMVDDGTRQLQNFIFTSMPGTQGGTWSGSINGGQSFAHEILIDGISIGRMDLNGGSNNEFTPTVDAVSEFKLQTGATSSQYGNSQTGLTNFAMKSGTNEYHGTAFWFAQNEALNAMSWGDNAAGLTKKPRSRLNNFGATFGGPIIKDRTHFFFSYEGNRQSNYSIGNPRGDSLPVKPFKSGDFSLLLDPNFTNDARSGTVVGQDALGRDVLFGQVYDPASSYQLADGTWMRNTFPNNVIPANRMSPVSKNILRYDLPEPQLFQLTYNNPRVGTCCPELNIDNYSLKVDHVLNEAHKMSGTYVFNDRSRLRYGSGSYYYLPEPRIPSTPLAGDKTQATPGWIGRFSEDWTIGPTRLNHFALGYNRFFNKNVSNSYFDGRDWAKDLGLQGVAGATFPELRFAAFDNTLSGRYRYMGHRGTSNEPNGSVVVADDFTLIQGGHSFRIGGEHRRYYLNGRSVNTPARYQFHNEDTALPGSYYKGDPANPDTARANGSTVTGFAYASFFLGEVRNTDNGVTVLTPGIRSRTTALYFQDDWKVRSNVTLNLGIRWDIPTALSEAAGRMSGLDPTLPNPGADGYPGALEFLPAGQDSFGKTYWKEFGPRIGIAWAKGQKMVIRGGYGINYAPPIMDGWDFGYFNGFNGSNNINVRANSRFNEEATYNWNSPYPAYTKTLPNTDPTLVNGGDISYYGPEANRLAVTQNWNFGIQYELPWETKLEANYVGTRGTRLNDGYIYYLNQLNPKYLSLGDTLLDDISDHPEIPKPYPSFEGTLAQALRPFPQYYSVSTHRLSSGWSNYHSLQVTATKRGSSGLSFLLAYTYSKALGTSDSAMGYYGSGQDIYNRRADYAITSFNVPHDLRVTWIYDLPSRVVGQAVLDRVIGGWSMSAIQHYRSGAPISIGTGGYEGEALFNYGFRPDVLLPTDQQKLAGEPTTTDLDNGIPYLNPAAFASLPTTPGNIPLQLGNAPRFLDGIRGFKQLSEDFSLLKKVNLGFRESSNVEIRIDVTNLFNRARPEDPRTNIDDLAEFGRSYGKVGGGRTIQGGLRVNF
jgi:hypothetical protein